MKLLIFILLGDAAKKEEKIFEDKYESTQMLRHDDEGHMGGNSQLGSHKGGLLKSDVDVNVHAQSKGK